MDLILIIATSIITVWALRIFYKNYKNKRLNKMAVSITKTPKAVSLSGNPIYFEITADDGWGDMDFYGIHFQMKQTSDDSNIGGEQRYVPDADGKVLVDVAPLLRRMISGILTWPEVVDSYLIDRGPVAMQYYLSVVAKSGNPLTNGSTVDSDDYYALQGGVSKVLLARWEELETSFYDEFIAVGRFLTSAPRKKTVDRRMPERIYFYNDSDADYLRLRFRLHYDDGSSEVITRDSDDEPGLVYEILTGYFDLELYADGKITGYDIWIEGSEDEETWDVVSEERSYIIDDSEFDNVNYFLFENNLGVLECFRTTGDIISSEEVEAEEASGVLPYGFVLADRQLKRITISEFIKFSVNTGWIDDLWFTHLRQAFNSDRVFVLDGDDLLPVIITTREYGGKSSADGLRYHVIEYIQGYPDKYQAGSSGLIDTDSIGVYWKDMGVQEGETTIRSIYSPGYGIVLAGTGTDSKIMKSTDHGKSFSYIQDLVEGATIYDMAGEGRVVIAAARVNFGLFELWRSTDLGETWASVYDSSSSGMTTPTIATLFSAGNGVFIAGISSSPVSLRMLRSDDYGATWSLITTAIADGNVRNACGFAGLSSGLIIAFNAIDYYISDDVGLTWSFRGTGNTTASIKPLVINDVIFMPFYTHLKRSDDGGLTWEDLSVTDATIWTMEEIPGNRILAWLVTGGFAISEDYGVTWKLVNAGVYTSSKHIGRGVIIAGDNTGRLHRSVPSFI